ncbi:DVU3141 family protein [Shewanella youngdeokensis]|uniref:DVU3141 family protein n=1 Tax=Shewanella youngdeokensis TaxID=2999068 RepID=A0ABZ0K3E8_9GAMM|nr:DVU3141 family protein [Shewanella sp. DAU334]
MKPIINFLAVAPVLFLVACSSTPPTVKAKRNMIETVKVSNSQQTVPKELWLELSRRQAGEVILYQDVNIKLEQTYISALGTQCHKVSLFKRLTSLTPQTRVVCQSADSSSWVMTPNVIDNKNELISLGNDQ